MSAFRQLRCALTVTFTVGALLAAAGAGSADDKDTAQVGSSVIAATVSAGNDFYRVHVQDSGNVGLYTVTTGPLHPAGAGLDVLFENGPPATTFNTIRSHTSGTDYVQKPSSSSNPTVVLGAFGSVVPIGTTGFRVTYTLPGPPQTPDALTIVQDVNANGTTFTDSTVEVTTSVRNDGASPVAIGIRYLWDFRIGNDDGPTFQEFNPLGAVRIHEAKFASPVFEFYSIVDNDINAAPPTFNVFGTVTGPGSVSPRPTAPDVLKYVCWQTAFPLAWDYTVNPLRDIATTASDCRGFAGGDVAVLYYFGEPAANAIVIPPGETRSVSASLLAVPPRPNQPPVWNEPPTPADGTVFTIDERDTLSVALQASDPDAGDTVQITAPTLPPAATISASNGNPATATVSWTTLSGDAGTHMVAVDARDDRFPSLSAGQRTFWVVVRAAVNFGVMTGGGKVFTAGGTSVTHGFRLDCNAQTGPNQLQVNWGRNRFHLENLSTATCIDDPMIEPGGPIASFDTHRGSGTGRLNGVSGAVAQWVFTDAGEPGTSDKIVSLRILSPGGTPVLEITDALLANGNHQAHDR